jgi:hypothetical protein
MQAQQIAYPRLTLSLMLTPSLLLSHSSHSPHHAHSLQPQGFDDFEIIDFEKKPPTGKSRLMGTPTPKPSDIAGPVSRASLAVRAAAAAAAAAGVAVRNTRDTVTWLLHKVRPAGGGSETSVYGTQGLVSAHVFD